MSAPASPTSPVSPDDAAKRRRQRTGGFLVLAFIVLVGAGGWYLWRVIVGNHVVSTDNAYVGASLALITPQIDGTILSVPIHETQEVKRGDVLVNLDPLVPNLLLQKAEAEYRQAVSRVQGYHAADLSAAAQIQARDAEIASARSGLERAQSDLDRAQADLARRQSLAGSGAVSAEEVTTAQSAVRTAQANLRTAQGMIDQAAASKRAAEANLAQQKALSGPSVESNPEVALARTNLEGMRINLHYTTLKSPIDGVIAGNKAQIGQRIQAGTLLMTIVPVQDAFADANFKEAQLRRVRVGQKAELVSDLYGKDVVFHGTVIGIGGGTGAAFAAIPAQNATGNWIKVVQRVPVRVALDPRELAAHPLRVGLSMSARIEVGPKAAPAK